MNTENKQNKVQALGNGLDCNTRALQLLQKLLSGWEHAGSVSVLGFRWKCYKPPYVLVICSWNCHWMSGEAPSSSD